MTDRWTKEVAHAIKSPPPLAAMPRQGVVVDLNPLTITLGGSDVRIPGVARLMTTWTPQIGDTVHVLRWGTDVLVLGPTL